MFQRKKKFLRQHSEPTHTNSNSNELSFETIDSHSLDGKRVQITFQVPKQGDECFRKSFKYSFSVSDVKEKFGKLLKMSKENIDILKDGISIADKTLILELDDEILSPSAGYDIVTKDGSFIDVDAVKEKFKDPAIVTFKKESPKKTVPPIVTCKFNVVRQYHTFTKSFQSSATVKSVRDDICSTFMIEGKKLVMINKRIMLDDDTQLAKLEMDNFGNIEIKLFTNDGTKLKFDLLYKDTAPITDILSVTVPKGENSFVNINVEVIDAKMIKPYLGGYRNRDTGKEFHHAFSQTPQRKERVPADMKNNRDTQTVSLRTKNVDTSLTCGTQMSFQGVYIPCVSDVIITPKPYETYAEMMARINPDLKATVIQRAWRSYRYRKAVYDWLKRCKQRIEDLKTEELNDARATELRLRQEIVKKTFPRTREDFDQLYAMVDRWRNSEIARISKLHTKGPKIAEFCLLLDKEIEMLRSIEKFRAELREDNRILKEKRLLEAMSSPVVWKTVKGLHVSMDTLEAQHSRYLKDLYYSFCKTDIKFEERMELLVNFKITLQNYKCPLEEQLTSLIDRECDLMVRNVSNKDLEILRKRIQSMVFKFIHLPQFNKGSMRRNDLKKQNNMKDERLYRCKECGQVKTYKDFPLHSQTTDMEVCTSCNWGNSANNTCSEMMLYTYILRAIRREERRKRCWSSLAFVLQDNDIYYIVEKIWHSRSAVSEATDISDLRLCRWRSNKEWAPWNCILLTTKEVKSHLQLENPEQIYDSDLVQKVRGKHLLARAHFSNLAGANDEDEEDLYSLPTTQASSVDQSV